jgi:hypothetical protein
MAGQALDPNATGGPDLMLGELLLAHTLKSIAQAIEHGEPIRSEAEAIAALEESGLLSRAAGGRNGARSVLECLAIGPVEPRDPETLRAAELLLGRVARVVQGEPAVARARRWSRWGVALLCAAGAAAIVSPAVHCDGPWDKYRWTASSAAWGYSTSGVLRAQEDSYLFFHTVLERRPSITIDLLETRPIHSVTVINRPDCCDERCLPLFIEAAGDDEHFVEVGHRTDPFGVWRAEFTPRRAHYVRLWVDAKTYFHLKGLEIR